MKAYTDLEQSKKLLEILPLESADMFHFIHEVDTVGFGYKKDAEEFYSKTEFEYTPCWSFTALFSVLPEGYSFILTKSFNGKDYYCKLDGKPIETMADNLIDACYEMILKLNEQRLL